MSNHETEKSQASGSKTKKKNIINCLNFEYGIAATTLTFLPIGADMDASVYKAEENNGQSYFVKLKRNHHSDIHAGNVLIDESNAIYIVDWDEPILAPKERDLMFIGGGVANVWNNRQEEEFFYKGYGKTNINRIILAYYRYERIVQDIVEYAESLLLTSDEGVNRQEMYKQFMGMFEANGVVDIAFKTDEGCIL